ncbi:HAD-IA family hydrolase [Gracilibacillus salitolerans]|uniref:HAD-IA family hydrolase n=1 Tax=Gracilibacillus salitolerans TaxID=2663022 RepID=A0A5Q2TQ27_9BACI|nr:HAD-IA family hydrolase [Gracilibacillus salitolerans]QGH36227.1 HAD-IA family hydrolase [Gracilibacillus salitolerans]
MLKAIIMDFDGVIIDTEVIWYDIFAEWFMKNKNYHLSMNEFLQCVGADTDTLIEILEERSNLSIEREKFLNDTNKIFIERSERLPAKDGVVRVIESIKNAGLTLTLATSSSRPKPIKHLTRLGLIDYFDAIVTADDVSSIKPSPDLFLKALEKANVHSEEAVIIEDSENGLLAASKANVKAIWVPNDITKHSNTQQYYKKIKSLSELIISDLASEF